MSKTTVKKALAQLDAEALREMIMEMYAARREARDYLEFWVNPDTDRELDTAKTKIQKLFSCRPTNLDGSPTLRRLRPLSIISRLYVPNPN